MRAPAASLLLVSLETNLHSRGFNAFVIRLARYRPFYFAIAVALLLSMAMPLVTYACDLTGLLETPMTMAGHTEGAESDCPCEGPMEAMCASTADDCAAVANCHGNAFDTDACCSSQPELNDGVVSASKDFLQVQPAVVAVAFDLPARMADRESAAPGNERAPPHAAKAPIHILHASLLL